jgi:hypothetical protein
MVCGSTPDNRIKHVQPLTRFVLLVAVSLKRICAACIVQLDHERPTLITAAHLAAEFTHTRSFQDMMQQSDDHLRTAARGLTNETRQPQG